jgi:L-glyceraldehyde 3-phosphate reductase
MASALIGASKVEQIEQCVSTQDNLRFDAKELQRIERILAGAEA